MKKDHKKAFTIIELLIVVAIIALLSSVIFIRIDTARAEARDSKRKSEADSLRKALEFYNADNSKYPQIANWIKIEQDVDEGGPFNQAMNSFFPSMPRDPLYPKEDGGKVFSYQYKSANDGSGYKLHIEMETGVYASYEVSSGSGAELVYGGGGGGGGPSGPPPGYGLLLDGVDDYVEVADSNSLDVADAITIELWIKPNTVVPTADWRTVIAKQASAEESYGVLMTEDQTYFYFFVRSGGVSFAGVDLTPGQWHHIIGTWDKNTPGDNIFLYVDGAPGDGGPVGTTAIAPTTLPVYMGGDPGSGYSPYEFAGVLDELRIYNRAISATEAQEHYNGTFNNESGLVALWSFDEGLGITAADSSGNGNDGALKNGTQWVSVP